MGTVTGKVTGKIDNPDVAIGFELESQRVCVETADPLNFKSIDVKLIEDQQMVDITFKGEYGNVICVMPLSLLRQILDVAEGKVGAS